MPTPDLADMIATARDDMRADAEDGYEWSAFPRAFLTKLLDAAEAGMKARDAARDAALEEAARVAEAIDPEKPANWLHARHKIAFEIRALKVKP